MKFGKWRFNPVTGKPIASRKKKIYKTGRKKTGPKKKRVSFGNRGSSSGLYCVMVRQEGVWSRDGCFPSRSLADNRAGYLFRKFGIDSMDIKVV